MKRMLCVVGGVMNTGGAETFLMKIYRKLDKRKYQIDFCVCKPEKAFYDDEIQSMGGRIIRTVEKSKSPFKSFYSIYKIVKTGNYKYVMRLSQHALSALDMVAARLGGAEVIVFRSSNSMTTKSGISFRLHQLFKFLPNLIADVKIAPSSLAAEFMFGKTNVEKGNVLLLNNGIPLEDFTFSGESRDEIRKKLDIGEQLLLGHIGRFSNQKNHKELISIFSEVLKYNPNAHLMLVGDGNLKQEVKNQVEKLGLKERVHFMGVRKDIPELLSAMDVFVFPSFYEGMPNTVIEAQANGVPCVIADTITPEVKMCENVALLPLGNSKIWVEKIIHLKRMESQVNQDILKEYGYDINNVVNVFIDAVF